MTNPVDPSILKTIGMVAHATENVAGGKLSVETLAEALKLASLPTEHERKLSPITVLAAVKFAHESKHPNDTKQSIHFDLSPEALAAALKAVFNEPHLEKAHADGSTAQAQSIVTAETVNKAVELAKK